MCKDRSGSTTEKYVYRKRKKKNVMVKSIQSLLRSEYEMVNGIFTHNMLGT